MNDSQPSPELQNVVDFLHNCIPFDQLNTDELLQLAGKIEIAYFRKGHIFTPQQDPGGLRIIRSGAAELRNKSRRLLDRFGESVSFSLSGLNKEEPGVEAILIEDSLVYWVPEPVYQGIRKQHRDFDRFFHSQRSRRVRRAAHKLPSATEMMKGVGDLMNTNVLQVAPDATIQEAALLMSERRVSSVVIMEQERLVGIVTDRDIRSRAVATGLDLQLPVSHIMTVGPKTISPDKTLFDATLFMAQKGIHHLPVVRGFKHDSGEEPGLVGIVTASDLMLARRDDPVYLVQHLGKRKSVAELQSTTRMLPELLVQWVNADIRAEQAAYLLTTISDAVTRRLIDLYIQDAGPAPVPFTWLGFGSQGRAEQMLGGDQDNALLIADELQPEEEYWFKGLAHFVCDGLNACGYVYCPGDVMATTAEWRQTLKVWKRTVDGWCNSPTPAAVMRVSIFFDIRAIYGSQPLMDALQAHMLDKTSRNSIFLASLAENVLENTPPLGIFRRFVVEHNGEHADELDLKKRGLLPIVDLVRIHALAEKVTAVNTLERLEKLAECKALSINDSRNLRDAMRVIMQTRMRAQAQELVAAQTPNNYVNPNDLSKMVRKQLRDSFAIVADAQQAIRLKYRPGL